jgi:DNA-binding transcriptional LysR family regulator
MLDAALAGLGVAYVMDCAARPFLRDKRLVRVLEPFCQPFPGFFLYYPSRAQMAPKLRAFVEFFRSRVRRPAARDREPSGAR